MQFTSFTDYSLRALMYLAINDKKLCTVNEISEYYNIPRNHMVKIVHNLAVKKYIITMKGKNGGIKLNRKPEEINLKDAILEFEANLNLVECFDLASNNCSITKACGLKGILRESLDSFLATLSKYTLADTIKNPEKFVSFSDYNKV